MPILHARRRRAVVALTTSVVVGLGLASVGAADATSPPATTVGRPAVAMHQAEQRPLYLDAKRPVRQRVHDLLQRMTLAEKVGQMTQAERAAIDDDTSQITRLHLGSVLSGGGSVPTPNRPRAWADMVDRYQSAALQTRLRIPLLYGIDSVHGNGNMYGATVFPHNIGLGATRDPALVRRVSHLSAMETRATGPQWVFAPCVCVARDDRWGRTYESFGETPALVKRMATSIDGFQGRPGQLDDNTRVLASAKHFAGDGLTTYGTGSNNGATGDYPIDQGVAQVTHRQFRRLALSPYVPAIKRHHVGTIMPSYSDVDWREDGLGNRVNMHGHKALITGWLKGEQHFRGFVISDYKGIDHISPETLTYEQQVAAGVNAGIDMFMEVDRYELFVSTLVGLVRDGTVPRSRVNDAVRRILTAKFELGLFEHPYTDRTHLRQVGSKAHRAVARTAVAESQVLLKNRHRTLPLRADASRPVYVAGSNADNIGNQAGGWTLTWQGGSTNQIPGTTILQAIRGATGNVRFSEDASAPIPQRAVGVVVVGETPYAEGFGDVNGPRWAYDPGDNGQPRPAKTMRLSETDADAVSTVCREAARCVVLVVSGRPMVIPGPMLQQIDALVASWLPGSEGDGVADVVFGKRPFTGKLPVTWPRTVAQEPINIGDAHYHPRYRFGFGLTTR